MGYSGRRRLGSFPLGRLVALCGLVLVALFVLLASAGADTPTVNTLTISPSSINTTSSSASVKVSSEITSTSGISGGSVQFESPTGSQKTERVSLSLGSGTVNKGVWEANVTFKRFIGPGTWKISSLNLNDKDGDTIQLTATQLQAKGFTPTVSVTSTE